MNTTGAPLTDKVALITGGARRLGAHIARVLHNDPATGVMRHADAGYDIAKDCARAHNLDLPMLDVAADKGDK